MAQRSFAQGPLCVLVGLLVPGDGRKPLRLLPLMADHQNQSMREHLAAVQAVVEALARDDALDRTLQSCVGHVPAGDRRPGDLDALHP